MPPQLPLLLSSVHRQRRCCGAVLRHFSPRAHDAADSASAVLWRRSSIAVLAFALTACSPSDSAYKEALRLRDATATTPAVRLSELVSESAPELREFSWTVQTGAPWGTYAASIQQRLRDYEMAGMGESSVEFVRLLPGDQYVLRVEEGREPRASMVVAHFRAMPR